MLNMREPLQQIWKLLIQSGEIDNTICYSKYLMKVNLNVVKMCMLAFSEQKPLKNEQLSEKDFRQLNKLGHLFRIHRQGVHYQKPL
jgi:hypothetical protein